MDEAQAAQERTPRGQFRQPGQLPGDRFLQGRAEKRGDYSLLSHGDTEKLVNGSGAKNAQEQRLNIRMFFDPRQRDLPRGGRVMRIIKNRQTASQLRLRIDPEQDLVRELIADGCSRLPESNIENVSVRIVGNARGFHRFSPVYAQKHSGQEFEWKQGKQERRPCTGEVYNGATMSLSPRCGFKMQTGGDPVWDQTVIDPLKIFAAAGLSWRGKAQSSLEPRRLGRREQCYTFDQPLLV